MITMTITKASTQYTKQDGTLQYDTTKQAVTWLATASGTVPPLSIALADITNLQQTPADKPKVALRIVVQPSTASTPENHTFNFTSKAAARDEQIAITDALRNAISAIKAGNVTQAADGPSVPGTPAGGEGQSASMAMASAVRSTSRATAAAEAWYDDQKLRTNAELQQSLLRSDNALRERFEQSLREKPDTISNGQFALQFWSARIHLLRAHAIERSQTQGTYNVLAEVKPKIVDGVTRLNLSKEQIQLIFTQHPLVKQVYNEVVPGKLSEMEFWARFFVSKLFKKLKGERITDNDSTDTVLDEYLNMDEDTMRRNQLAEAHIPHFMDLEGNEQNHSQRKGNRADFDMRPNTNERVPILRALNNMSEKMMMNVAPSDTGLFAPAGVDEETFNQIRLSDLQDDDEEDRVVLHIADQRKLFGVDSGANHQQHVSVEAQLYAKADPTQVLSSLAADLSKTFSLEAAATLATSDTTSAATATKQITSLVAQRRALLTSTSATTTLTPTTLQSLLLTHNTTTEFLHYFWTLLLQPNSAAARRDLPSLLTTLTNSLARIDAVASEAEKERQGKIGELKRKAEEYRARTGKKMRLTEDMIGIGGKSEVEGLMGGVKDTIAVAKDKWQAAVTL